MAKMGSRLLSRWSILLYDMASRINELRYDVLVRHGCSGKVCCTGLEVVDKDKAAQCKSRDSCTRGNFGTGRRLS
jgi:hypothetical protein